MSNAYDASLLNSNAMMGNYYGNNPMMSQMMNPMMNSMMNPMMNSMMNPMFSQNYNSQYFLDWLRGGYSAGATLPYASEEAVEKFKKEKEQRYIDRAQEEIKKIEQEKADLSAEKAKIKDDKKVKEDRPEKSISFWQGLKSVGKGLVKSVIGAFTDEKGKLSWRKALKTVVVGAAVVGLAAATGGTSLLIGAGVLLGGVEAVKGGIKFANAKTQKEQKAALEDVGEGLGIAVQSGIGLRSLNVAKAAKAAELAKNIEGIAQSAGKNSAVFQEAVTALRASKGRGANYRNAVADLKGLVNNKSELAQIETLLNSATQKGGIFRFNNKNISLVDKAKLTGKLSTLTPARGIANAKRINELAANINKATTKLDLLKALADAKKVVSELNIKGGNGKYNELEVLIAQGERALKTKLLPSIPTRENIIQAGGKVVQGAGKLVRGEVPRDKVFGTLVIANNLAYGSRVLEKEAEEAKLEQEKEIKLQEQQKQIEAYDTKLTESEKAELNQLAELADHLEIKVEEDDTVKSLKEKIDKKLTERKEAEAKEAEKKEAEKKEAEKKDK